VSDNWVRVTKKNPCPVCNRPDWCTIGDRFVCCMRVHSSKQAENGGYLHPIDEKHPKPPPRKVVEEAHVDCSAMMWNWLEFTTPESVEGFAKRLGVSTHSLHALDVAWAKPYSAWAFPMRDGDGNIIGIRLRTEDGQKFSVKGSHQGIFTPCCAAMDTVYVCEGPTDTAAAFTIGIYALGRASCVGGIDHVKRTLKRKGAKRVVVISDNDGPGLRGSETLMLALEQPSCRLVLPAKDMRAFVKDGGTCAMLDSILKNMKWTRPWLPEQTVGSGPTRLGTTTPRL